MGHLEQSMRVPSASSIVQGPKINPFALACYTNKASNRAYNVEGVAGNGQGKGNSLQGSIQGALRAKQLDMPVKELSLGDVLAFCQKPVNLLQQLAINQEASPRLLASPDQTNGSKGESDDAPFVLLCIGHAQTCQDFFNGVLGFTSCLLIPMHLFTDKLFVDCHNFGRAKGERMIVCFVC